MCCWTRRGSCHLPSYSWQVTAALQLRSLLVRYRLCFEHCPGPSPVFPYWYLGDAFSCGSRGLSSPLCDGSPRSSAGKWHAPGQPSPALQPQIRNAARLRTWTQPGLAGSSAFAEPNSSFVLQCSRSMWKHNVLLDSLQWTTWIVWMKVENRWRSTTCVIGWTRPRDRLGQAVLPPWTTQKIIMCSVILKDRKHHKNMWMQWMVMLTYSIVYYISIDFFCTHDWVLYPTNNISFGLYYRQPPISMFWDEDGAFVSKCDGALRSKFRHLARLKPIESGLNSCSSFAYIKFFRSVYRDTGLSVYRYVSRPQNTGTPRCTGESRHPYLESRQYKITANHFGLSSVFTKLLMKWNSRSLCQRLRWHQDSQTLHDDVIKWQHFPCYWPFVRGIHWSLVNSHHKGQWLGALMFVLIWAWTHSWVNNWAADDLRYHYDHYDVTVMKEWVGETCSQKRYQGSSKAQSVCVCVWFSLLNCITEKESHWRCKYMLMGKCKKDITPVH